ncbi:MAG: 16S rRNA (guanine1516-N2)-methyltransferase [Saprospiraceae bacterium]|jgi:16S rRNA (guanine1516-N2)-methyltransferase
MTINVNKPPVGLLLTEGEDETAIKALAQHFGVPIISEVAAFGEPHILMKLGVLQLVMNTGKKTLSTRVDFSKPRFTAGKVDPLIRAMGGANRRVLDMTAGWGRDAHHLASNGYWVSALEQHPAIALMLEQSRRESRDDITSERLRFYHHDSRHQVLPFINKLESQFVPLDVVYIDPMFPPKRKRSAAVKKEVVLLQAVVEAYCANSDTTLLDQALQLGVNRVVIKRPTRAAPVAGRAPNGSVDGKLVRFDIYSPN